MRFKNANNARSKLAVRLDVGGDVLTLLTGTGSMFPATLNDYFVLTISNSTGTITEIVHVVERAGDVCTVERAKEGTTALTWPAGSNADQLWTAGQAQGLVQSAPTIVATEDYTARNLDFVDADTTDGSFTVFLPETPALGDTVVVNDPNGSWAINPLLLDPNGELLDGVEEINNCNVSAAIYLIFTESGWVTQDLVLRFPFA